MRRTYMSDVDMTIFSCTKHDKTTFLSSLSIILHCGKLYMLMKVIKMIAIWSYMCNCNRICIHYTWGNILSYQNYNFNWCGEWYVGYVYKIFDILCCCKTTNHLLAINFGFGASGVLKLQLNKNIVYICA